MQITNLKRLILEATDLNTGRRMTNYQVAAATGIHPSTLSTYALGKHQLPWQHREILADYFGVAGSSLDEMVDVDA